MSDESGDVQDLKLEHKWTLYIHFISKDRHRYAHEYMPIATLTTVGDFWRLFNNIPLPSMLFRYNVMFEGRQIVTYSIFREGVLPEWEHPCNARGAEWCMREHVSLSAFDDAWMDACLAVVGCTLNCVGVRVTFKQAANHRIVQKLEVWMDSATKKHACLREVKNCIDLRAEWQYFPHDESRQRATS